ncbi:cytochrome P450 [Kitasatospora kazusensis]|uniref:cytochrome P450 n=1 Tax=Kitasatospora kazusensis TaxID=407974 RepID=UPI0031DC700B
MPFGTGSRQCIGDAFARAGTAITLATVLQRRRRRPVPGRTTRATPPGPRSRRCPTRTASPVVLAVLCLT